MSLRDQIDAAIAASVNTIQRRLQGLEQRGYAMPEIVIGQTAAGGVAALSGTTPGKATDIAEYKINSSDELEATGRTLTGYNLASTAVAGNAWIMLKQSKTGQLLIDFEDCG